MTDCADSTTLRAHLDRPDPRLDAHLDACDACAGLLRSVAADAGITRRALALLEAPAPGQGDVDVEAALAAVRTRGSSTHTTPLQIAPSRATPAHVATHAASRGRGLASIGRRVALSGAAALLVLVVALTPAGRGAVAQALDVFRGEQLQVVTVDTDAWASSVDGEDVQALASLGAIDTSGLVEPAEVADVTEAEAVSGIDAPRLVETPDRLVALAPGTARLVLETRDGNGVPAELDGASLVVEIPGAIGAVHGAEGGPPELVVGRSGPLTIQAEGASLEALRSFVLSREELPADLRDQLAALGDWRSTIPLPVPVGGPGWEEVEVAGRAAIAFGDDSGLGALVLRQDPDGVTVVGGTIGITRALELAAGA